MRAWKLLCMAGIALAPGIAFAADAQPAAFTYRVGALERVDHRLMPAIDLDKLREEDARRPAGAPVRFATAIPQALDPSNAGTWESTNARVAVWRLRITSPGAKSLNLGFDRFHMPDGGTLLVYPVGYAKGGATDQLRRFDASYNHASGQLWTPIVDGDDIVVEVQVPQAKRAELKLELASVNHDYAGLVRLVDEAKVGHVSGAC